MQLQSILLDPYRLCTARQPSCFTLNWLPLHCLFHLGYGEFRVRHLHGPPLARLPCLEYLVQGLHLFFLRYSPNELAQFAA
jgi:hypothetical protein